MAFKGKEAAATTPVMSTSSSTEEKEENKASSTASQSASTVVGDGEDEKAVTDAQGSKQKDSNWKTDQVHVVPKNNLWIVFPGLMLTVYLAAMDQTIVSTALPTIARDLKSSGSAYSWVGTAYFLTATSLSPLFGKFAAVFGRKPVLFTVIIFFLVGSALCGAAKTMIWLCIARGLQGVGGGGIIQLTQIIIADIVPLHNRAKFSGLLGTIWGIAGVTGPLIGGIFTDKVNWRWCFYFNLPTGGIALCILFFFLKLNPHTTPPISKLVREFDFIGLFLLVGGLVILLVGFSSGETAWDSAETIALLAVGGVMLVIACIHETRTKKSPIIPPRLFRTRTTAALLISTFAQAYVFIAISFYLPVYFQARGATALTSGLRLMPFSVVSAVVSIGSGFLISKTGRPKEPIYIGFFVFAIGTALLATLDEHSNLGMEVGYQLIAAFGVGPLFQAIYLACQSSVKIEDMPTATSTIGLIRSLGGTIGISVSGALYASQLKSRLASIPGYTGAAITQGDLSGLKLIQPEELRMQVLHAYTRAVNTPWILAAPMLLIGGILCVFQKHYSLQRKTLLTGKSEKKIDSIEEDEEKAVGERNKVDEEIADPPSPQKSSAGAANV